MTKIGQRFDRCPKKWLIEQGELMQIIGDIRTFTSSGVLPWGPSKGEQDPLFWQAVDVFTITRAQLAESSRPKESM